MTFPQTNEDQSRLHQLSDYFFGCLYHRQKNPLLSFHQVVMWLGPFQLQKMKFVYLQFVKLKTSFFPARNIYKQLIVSSGEGRAAPGVALHLT